MPRRGNGEGTITLRADGRWMARLSYLDPITGQRERSTFYAKTAREVRAKLKDARDRIEAQIPPKDASRTGADWLTHWRATTLAASDRKPATRELYASLSRVHLEPAPFGALTLDRLRPSDITALILALRAKGLADSTIRSTYTVARSALTDAVTDGLLARNPAALVKRPGVERAEARHLDPEGVNALLRATQASRYHLALVLIASTGLRKGEALALAWDAVDLDAGVLRVAGTIGRIGGRLVVSAPKTARSRRIVPVHAGVVAMLRRHRVTQMEERLRAGDQWTDSGLVFTTELGGSVDPRNLLRVVESAAKRAGLDDVGVHTLRHSAAVTWLEGGVHIKAVADLLGHSSIAVTGDVYGHTSDGAARSAVEHLGGQLGL
jgi:integrase